MSAFVAAPVTAIVTAFRRPDVTLATLQRIAQCEPPPAEVLVHVDGHEMACADAIRAAFPSIAVMVSDANIGPGGGRNRLVEAATNEVVASFDDDSYPIDADYFRRVVTLFERYPGADVVCGRVFQQNEAIEPAVEQAAWVADFEGGGSSYRRRAFLENGGYLPLPVAYGMEEVDFALRLHARGRRVLRSPWLRVYHDADLRRHADPQVTAASLRNLALLTFLRYPAAYWGVGVAQCLNRIQWLLRNGRQRGIIDGLFATPGMLWRHRKRRDPLPVSAVRSYFRLRRAPVPA